MSKQVIGTWDVIVVGGGMAGLCAAIAAARLGSSVALLQDRPVLGGNSSNEIRVCISGAEAKGFNRNARETGILEELRLEERYRSPASWTGWGDNGQPRPDWDWILWEWVNKEPNLSLYLNTRALKPIMHSPDTISGIVAYQSSTERTLRLGAKIVIDCSGDGKIAADAGAEFRLGREARSEYGEDLAPDEADEWVLSPSLMFSARDTGRPVPFIPPSWARDFPAEDDLPDMNHMRVDCGYWWIECGGTKDPFRDAEEIRDDLLAIVYGVWDHIKNHGDHGADNYALDWVGTVLGRRESRRFLGDYVLTQNDLDSLRIFPDQAAFGGWMIDIHPPDTFESKPHRPAPFWPLRSGDGGFLPKIEYPWGWGLKISRYMRPDGEPEFAAPIRGLFSIPFRSLYSRNIRNLMFAGRNISATHVAFGSTRLQSTCAIMGQAVGTAANLCIKYDTLPRGIYQEHIETLQQQLLRDDCYIIGLESRDPDDLARTARVTASSSAPLEVIEPQQALPLNIPRAQMFSGADGFIKSVLVYLHSDLLEEGKAEGTLLKGTRLDDFQSEEVLATAIGIVPANGWSWVEFRFDAEIESGDPYWIKLFDIPGLSWGFTKRDVLGTQRGEWVEEFDLIERMHGTYSFRVDPPLRPYEAQNVINGVSRAEKGSSLWMSSPEGEFPQWIRLEFQDKQTFDCVYLTFDTNLDKLTERGPSPECVRDYRLQYADGGSWVDLAHVKGNYQRRRVHRFSPTEAQTVRLVVEATNGVREARVYEIRVYREQ